MRFLYRFSNNADAKKLRDHLLVTGIESVIRDEAEGNDLWVLHDDDVSKADAILQTFLVNPEASDFHESSWQAKIIDADREEKERAWRKAAQFKLPRANMTIAFIVISVIVSTLTLLGKNTDPFHFLYITGFQTEGDYVYWSQALPEIWHGQIWRLVTPIFMHFGIMHIVFNMLWLRDLGSIIEFKHGKWYFLVLTLVIAALSNLGQFFYHGPFFGGMSGVVYGHLGFLWIRGRYDFNYQLVLKQSVVMSMIIWFFLCLTGVLGPIANLAHGVGLAAGMIWGYASSGHWRRWLKR